MKRLLCLLLILSQLFPLLGCGKGHQDQATFYYERAEYQYGSADAVLVPEARDITGHVGELRFLLSLYLTGPLDEKLTSPFPRGTRLEDLVLEDGSLRIYLSDIGSRVSQAQFSLACACLTLTCLELTSADQVTIHSGSRSITMDRDSLVLDDNIIGATTEGD